MEPSVNDFPAPLTPSPKVAPVPRRVRAVLGGETILDTTRALYVWEVATYPHYYVPLADVRRDVLVEEAGTRAGPVGTVRVLGLRVGAVERHGAARVVAEPAVEELRDTVRFDWAALEHWFEEDEEVFVHPRNPYVRVDALRSTRHVRVELDGLSLAESRSPVLVFETGLPTRYYLNRTEVHFEHLVPTDTVTRCPYKGTATAYWSVRTPQGTYPDLAWSYESPTRELSPIAGMLAFYNESVDLLVDGRLLERPQTHFSRPTR